MDIAGILQRLHHLMLAPTQAVAALIAKWEWRFTEVFQGHKGLPASPYP